VKSRPCWACSFFTCSSTATAYVPTMTSTQQEATEEVDPRSITLQGLITWLIETRGAVPLLHVTLALPLLRSLSEAYGADKACSDVVSALWKNGAEKLGHSDDVITRVANRLRRLLSAMVAYKHAPDTFEWKRISQEGFFVAEGVQRTTVTEFLTLPLSGGRNVKVTFPADLTPAEAREVSDLLVSTMSYFVGGESNESTHHGAHAVGGAEGTQRLP